MAQFVLTIDPEKCTGCRACEMVCSLHHTGECNPTRSRVRVIKWEVGVDMPVMCHQCDTPVCRDVCPTGAIYRDERTNAMLISQDMCIGCKMCIFACPFGGPAIDSIGRQIILCDLCEGDPMCVKVCETGAINYVRADMVGLRRKRAGIEKLSGLLGNVITVPTKAIGSEV